MNDSPLINKVFPDQLGCIDKEAKMSDFVASRKNWKLNNLKN